MLADMLLFCKEQTDTYPCVREVVNKYDTFFILPFLFDGRTIAPEL